MGCDESGREEPAADAFDDDGTSIGNDGLRFVFPATDATVSEPWLIVRGEASLRAGTAVEVNGVDAIVDEDGMFVAEVPLDAGGGEVCARGGGYFTCVDVTVLDLPAPDVRWTWDPAGDRVFFAKRDAIVEWPLDGAAARRVPGVDWPVGDLAWDARRQRLLTPRDGQVVAIDPGTAEVTLLDGVFAADDSELRVDVGSDWLAVSDAGLRVWDLERDEMVHEGQACELDECVVADGRVARASFGEVVVLDVASGETTVVPIDDDGRFEFVEGDGIYGQDRSVTWRFDTTSGAFTDTGLVEHAEPDMREIRGGRSLALDARGLTVVDAADSAPRRLDAMAWPPPADGVDALGLEHTPHAWDGERGRLWVEVGNRLIEFDATTGERRVVVEEMPGGDDRALTWSLPRQRVVRVAENPLESTATEKSLFLTVVDPETGHVDAEDPTFVLRDEHVAFAELDGWTAIYNLGTLYAVMHGDGSVRTLGESGPLVGADPVAASSCSSVVPDPARPGVTHLGQNLLVNFQCNG